MNVYSDNQVYDRMAAEIVRRMQNKSFLTIPKSFLRELLRNESANDRVRLVESAWNGLCGALATYDIEPLPGFDPSTADVRFYRKGTVIHRLAETCCRPRQLDDRELIHTITKVKGKWAYGDERDV